MSILSYSDKSLSSAGSSWVSSNTPSDSLKYCSSEEGDFEMDDEQYYSAEEYRDSKQKSGDDYENSLSDDSYDRCQTDDVWEETNQSSRSENRKLSQYPRGNGDSVFRLIPPRPSPISCHSSGRAICSTKDEAAF